MTYVDTLHRNEPQLLAAADTLPALSLRAKLVNAGYRLGLRNAVRRADAPARVNALARLARYLSSSLASFLPSLARSR